jgi:hypothetical protein
VAKGGATLNEQAADILTVSAISITALAQTDKEMCDS